MEAQPLHNVNKVSVVLVKTPGKPGDLTSILQHIAQTARDAFEADACVILAFNPITGNYLASQVVAEDVKGEAGRLHERPREDGVTQQVLRDGMVLIEDLDAKPLYHNRFTRKEGICAFAGLALHTRHRKRPVGVIYLDFKHSKKFSATDRESFQIFAVQAAFLLQETWLAHHFEEVAQAGQVINHNLAKVDDLFHELQKYVDTIFDDSHTFMLAIYQPQANTLDTYVTEQGHSIFVNTPLQGPCQYVLKTKEPQFIQQFSQEVDDLPFKLIDITGNGPKESLIFVPLLLRDVSLGVLSIQHPSPKAYGQEDLFILKLLASYIALALHNIRLYSGLSQLNETGQFLTQHLESEQTLQATADKIKETTKADVVVLYPYEPISCRFVFPPRIAGTLLNSSIQSMSPSRPDDIASLMLRHAKAIFAKQSTDLYTELHGDFHTQRGSFAQREQVRSTAAVPLWVAEESVGVLFVNFRQPQRFDATQKLFIEGLAHYAAIAIKNAQVFGTLSLRRVRELEILQNIDRKLSSTLELETILNTLLQLAHEHVPAEEASILLYHPHTQILETAAAIGRHAEISRTQSISLLQTKGITRWVLEHKKPVRVANVRRDLPWRELHLPVAEDTVSELDVPLLDGDEVVGVFNFESIRERAFQQEDQDFLLTLAGQAVLAIKNAQAYEREKRLVAEAQVLQEISKEITSQLDPAHIFDLILEKALELTHSTTGALMVYDHEQKDLWMAAERGVAEDKKGQRRFSLDQGIAGYVARGKQPLNVDPSQPPWNQIYLDFIPGTRSELAVPMLVGDELHGVLNVESVTPHNFSVHDERLLQELADLAVIALQNSQAYERERRLVAESQVLHEISKEITSQLDPTHVFDLILEKALELTRSTTGTLELYDADQDDLWMASERGVAGDKKGQRLRLDQGVVGYVATNKQSLNVDLSQPPWNEVHISSIIGTRSELAVPMLAGNELRGVLNVESHSPHNFSESDERLLQGLADLAVIALLNAERYEKAEEEALRFKLLYQVGQELSKITDLEQLEQAYKAVVQIAARQSQSQAVIYRYDEPNAEVVLACASEYPQAPLFERIKVEEGLNGQVAREHRTIVIHDSDHLPPDIAPIKQSDPSMHSLVVTPILFKDQYYGNLGLRHTDVGHFRGADILFFDWLAQQLASTIHRLETAKARQEFEKRALSAEEMSSIGQSAFEVTHRLGNDLGLVGLYISDIQSELQKQGVENAFISKQLENILQSTQDVLSFSSDLKLELAKLTAKEETASEPVMIAPEILLEEARSVSLLPATIQICLEVDDDVVNVQVIHNSVADILRNLVANAIQAMPEGGTLTLRAYNTGYSVALEVSDTGVGIPPQKLANIFDLFFSTKGSSGFGLWSARRNALKNRGTLKVESELGQGTTFTLLLPKTNGGTLESTFVE